MNNNVNITIIRLRASTQVRYRHCSLAAGRHDWYHLWILCGHWSADSHVADHSYLRYCVLSLVKRSLATTPVHALLYCVQQHVVFMKCFFIYGNKSLFTYQRKIGTVNSVGQKTCQTYLFFARIAEPNTRRLFYKQLRIIAAKAKKCWHSLFINYNYRLYIVSLVRILKTPFSVVQKLLLIYKM